MQLIIEFIRQPWPWYVAGPIISLVMFSLLWFGNRFGLSSNLRTLCAMAGAARFSDFFAFDWKRDIWNVVFVAGLIAGGAVTQLWLTSDSSVQIADVTKTELSMMGIDNPGATLAPADIFSWKSLGTWQGILMIVVGGFLVGFGTRYANGCTSGHAISGLSDLQLSSVIATVGFFLGGLLVTYFVLPHLLSL